MRTTVKILGIAAAAILSATPAGAALPPKYQRLAELRAVLEHPGVVAAFGDNQLVDGVDYVRTDVYRVRSGRCSLEVRIVDLPIPAGIVGPRRFEPRPGRRVCR